MTEMEAKEFLDVLKEYWPKIGELSPALTTQWVRRLKYYDFTHAKKALADYVFSRTKPGIPPIGAIMVALKPAANPRNKAKSEPTQLYVLIRQDGRRDGFPISMPREPKPEEFALIHQEATKLAEQRPNCYIQWLHSGLAEAG